MDKRDDPVDRLVRDCTPAEFVEWLVKYKKLPPEQAENVEINLREQFKWHRLQGRLDRPSFAAVLAQLLGLRGSPSRLRRPDEN